MPTMASLRFMVKPQLLIALFLLLFAGEIHSQTNTSSPYSRYGIGDLSLKAFGQNAAMGGLALGLRSSFHLNPVNMAANSATDTLSFRLELGMQARGTNFITNGASEKTSNSNYSFLAFGFPVVKGWGMSFGLIPYSNIGYKIVKDSTYQTSWGTDQDISTSFSGEGGIDQVFWGNGFNIGKHVSVGMNLSYLFGTLNQIRVVSFMDTTGLVNGVAFTTNKTNKIVVSDFMLGLNAQVFGKLNPKTDYCLGLVLEPKNSLKAYNSVLTMVENNYTTDTIEYTNDASDFLDLPMNLGIGFTLKTDKWLYGADFFTQDWSSARFLGRADSLSNSWRISTGIQFIPAERSVKSYFNRIRYRAGFNHSLTYLDLKGQHLSDQSISFGVGLPLWRSKSSLNLTYTFGKRGTTDANLIEEKYQMFSLNLSLHDIWFVKRKFD
jgi:hypothetical protein